MVKKYQKIIKKIKIMPLILAKNAFIASLIFVFISLILGVFLSYKYNTLFEKEIAEKKEDIHVVFNEKELEEVLQIQKERKQRLDQTNLKEYYNPFGLDSTQINE